VTGRPLTVSEPRRGLDLDLGGLWRARELLYFLVWREVKVRYRQTAIGAAWAIVQPALTVAVFAAIFGHFARLPSDGLPYPLFALAGVVPWTYFAQAVARSGLSLVGDANLIRKVYFPRLVIPVAAVVSPLVDLAWTLLVLAALMLWYGAVPTWRVLALPGFLGLAWLTALAAGLWLSALHVRYRDVGHTIPFLVQLWMYATPVVYPASLIPERWRPLYGLNPMAGVVEGFRWGLLGQGGPDLGLTLVSALVVAALLASGLAFFRRMERSFADVV
jgi:lipopolysaccharide transport system permease protein